MKSDCLEFADIPRSGQLFLDYLADTSSAMRFYGGKAPLQAPIAAQSAQHRAKIADILERQNRSFGASPQAMENIARLRGGANAIVTGQQAGLFGGPLLAMLKTLTAIRMAEQHNAVPVFWVASTDHDLAEVDHVSVVSGGKLHKISFELEATTGAMVSRAKIKSVTTNLAEERGSRAEQAMIDPVSALAEMFPQGNDEMIEILREAYANGARMGIAFASLWAALFGRYGLVMLDPDDEDLQSLAAPIYMRAASEAAALNDALRQRKKDLDDAGYHEQVKVTEETSLLFVDVEGARTPVRMVRALAGGVEFRAGGLHWDSESELAAWVKEHAGRVTPNALLRPVVQDYLLPTLAYVGGPAEIAYFAQATVLYDALLGGRTPVMARASATLIEPRIAEIMARYRIKFSDLLQAHSQAELGQELAKRVLPEAVGEAFAGSHASVEATLQQLGEVVQRLDPTLAAAAETAQRKIRYQLLKLEQRAARAQLRKQDMVARNAAVLWNNLRPQGELQERVIGGVEYLLKYGTGLFDVLQRELKMCAGHQAIGL